MLPSLAETHIQNTEKHMEANGSFPQSNGARKTKKIWLLAPSKGLRGQSRLAGPKDGIEGRQKEACLYSVPAFLSKQLMIPNKNKK